MQSQHNKPMSPGGSSLAQGRKMAYYTLDQAELDQDQVNFYGVVVDASYPYKTPNKFISSLKVIDYSMHTEGNEAAKDTKYATVIIYAKRFEDCPIVRRIGDVIRVHRAGVKSYQDRKQFHVNVNFNSSWCLFATQPEHANINEDGGMSKKADLSGSDSDEENKSPDGQPYKFSGKNYSFDTHFERPILDSIRKWSVDYLTAHSVFHRSNFMLLKNADKQTNEFDLLVKILKVFEKDGHTLELRIKDISNEMWFLTVPKLKFGVESPLRQGDIVRIRSVMREQTSGDKRVTCKPITNILKFLPCSRIVQDMRKAIQDQTDADKMLLEDASEVIMNPVVFTEFPPEKEKMYSKMQTFKLQDLFLDYENLPESIREKNSFKTRFYVLRVDPKDTREVVQAMCPECNSTTSCKDLGPSGKAKCTDCKGEPETKLIYMLQLLVKDQASQLNKNFFRVLLYSYAEGKGDSFFGEGHKPVNLYKNEEELRYIQKKLNTMQRFNVWMDCVLERKNKFFTIKDTLIKTDI